MDEGGALPLPQIYLRASFLREGSAMLFRRVMFNEE